MKTILFSVASALLVSGLAIVLCAACAARGETFRIIALLTVTVSCSTAFAAASIGHRVRKKSRLV
jgi:hypothetical protein